MYLVTFYYRSILLFYTNLSASDVTSFFTSSRTWLQQNYPLSLVSLSFPFSNQNLYHAYFYSHLKSLHRISLTSFFCPITQVHYSKIPLMLSILSVSKSFFIFEVHLGGIWPLPFYQSCLSKSQITTMLLNTMTNYHLSS